MPEGPVGPPTGPPPSPRPTREPAGDRRWWVLGVAIVALLAAGIGALVWPDGTGDDGDLDVAAPSTSVAPDTSVADPADPPASTPSTTPTTELPVDEGRAPDPALAAVIEELQAFVVSVRGREFRTPVDVRLFDDAAFDRILSEQFALDPVELQAEASRLVTLGLLSEEDAATYAEDRIAFITGVVDGLYLPEDDRLLVRDAPDSPSFRRLLVHELTHAFDDQWFDLGRTDDDFPVDSEAGYTLGPVAEGNAVRLDTLWTAAQPEDERAAAGGLGGLSRDGLDGLETHLEYQQLAAYHLGASFMEHVAALGGEAAVDAQLTTPAPTSEQVFFLDVFDRGERRVDVPAPPVPGGREILDEGPVGVSFWYGVLRYSEAELTVEEVEAAVDGWGGDWQVTWEQEEGVQCQRADVVGDTPADTDELRTTITAWVESTDGTVAVSDADGRIRVEWCIATPAGEDRI